MSTQDDNKKFENTVTIPSTSVTARQDRTYEDTNRNTKNTKKWKLDPTNSRSLKKRKCGRINRQTTNQSIFTMPKVSNEQNNQLQCMNQHIKNPAKLESLGNTPNSVSKIRTAISDVRRNFMLEHRRQTLTILKYIDDDIIIWSSRGGDLPFSDPRRSTREKDLKTNVTITFYYVFHLIICTIISNSFS